MTLNRTCGTYVAVFVVVGVLATGCAGTETAVPEYSVETSWGSVFEHEGVTGTFVLDEVGTDEAPMVYDVKYMRRDVAPAETFKLFATLVALSADILPDLDTELEWDGEGPEVPPWNRTHSLRSALDGEAEWFYAQVVDLVGEDPFEVWLDRAGYGNINLRGSRSAFWSDGTLTIDAFQMARFYADVFSDDPTFDRYAVFDVRDLMRTEEGDGWKLTWYTGTDDSVYGAAVGWLVGAVETDDGTWGVAMNVDLPSDAGLDLDLRKRITLAVLESQGIIPTATDI
ncbi:MAG: class D beta-lactamase [Acidimicrobiia bacterium]|nr:class D beta-lactamase [Acidimicrobiia bacterium]